MNAPALLRNVRSQKSKLHAVVLLKLLNLLFDSEAARQTSCHPRMLVLAEVPIGSERAAERSTFMAGCHKHHGARLDAQCTPKKS